MVSREHVTFESPPYKKKKKKKQKKTKKTTWNRLSETCAGRPTVTQKPVFGLVCKTQPRSLTSEISRRKRIVSGWDPRALEQENVKSDTDGRCIMRKLVLNYYCRRTYVFTWQTQVSREQFRKVISHTRGTNGDWSPSCSICVLKMPEQHLPTTWAAPFPLCMQDSFTCGSRELSRWSNTKYATKCKNPTFWGCYLN